MTPTKYLNSLERGASILVDIRDSEERKQGRFIRGSFHLPMSDILAGCELPWAVDALLVIMCEKGGRSQFISQILRAQGYNNTESLEGGYQALAKISAY